MRTSTHSSPAVAAIALILCAVGISFVAFMMITSNGLTLEIPAMTAPAHFEPFVNLARATGTLVLAGYAAGILGWLLAFALHGDGVHRLAGLQTRFARLKQPR